jgi:hypothetical protein
LQELRHTIGGIWRKTDLHHHFRWDLMIFQGDLQGPDHFIEKPALDD